ncbi:MAG: FtsL-like putative cell division protein [Cyclobacteriaceae bacterium]
MAANRYKVSTPKSGKSLFSKIEGSLRIPVLFENGLPVMYMPKVLFVTALVIFYIGNNHYADSTIRKIDKLKVEVEDLRADYTTLKSDYMFASKQSEIAKSVARLQIRETLEPPKKIVIRDSEY